MTTKNYPKTNISFTARVQTGNRISLPKTIRSKFQLDSGQIIRVNVNALAIWSDSPNTFFASINKDGRIAVPKLVNHLMAKNKINLTGQIVEVTVFPG